MSTTNLQQYNCDVCSISISRTVRINCADSVCTDWDACVACFAKGATREGSNHKPWHAYRVIAPIERPLFDPDWSGDEELSLLSGSEKFGLGNWSDVAEHVGNRRTKEECERHYIRVYIRSDAYPLPVTKVSYNWYEADGPGSQCHRRIRPRDISSAQTKKNRRASSSFEASTSPEAKADHKHAFLPRSARVHAWPSRI